MNDAAYDSLVTRIRNAIGRNREFAALLCNVPCSPTHRNSKMQALVRNEEGRIIARLPASVVRE